MKRNLKPGITIHNRRPIFFQKLLLVVLLLSFAIAPPFARTDHAIATNAERGTEDPNIALLNDVWEKVLAVVTPPPGLQWPPKLHVLTEDDTKLLESLTRREMPRDVPNAFATVCSDSRLAFCSGPVVCVNRALLERIVDGNTHRLAFILGHEISHLTLGHARPRRGRARSEILETVFSREKEIAADKSGIEAALAAGYSLSEALSAPRQFIELGMEHPPLWPSTHPSWTQRLARLDKERAGLWRQMGAFNNGVMFLSIEQYASAERCFEAVVREFPDCTEAQANLGYARLMQYCDLLTEDDLKDFDIGHIMIGGFYGRPDTLIEKSRGKNRDLWMKAVESLEEALRLNPDLALAKANLGIAYLVHPEKQDIEKAARYLEEARALTAKGASRMMRAHVLVNLGVAELAAGKMDLCDQHLNQAFSLAGDHPVIKATIFYNHALLQLKKGEGGKKRDATTALAGFLQATSPASIWWKLGFEQFSKLCSEQKVRCLTREEALARVRPPLRPVPSVRTGKGIDLQLGDSMDDVQKRLGNASPVPVVRGSNLKRLYYPASGVEVTGNEEVLAIALKGRAAPALELQRVGIGGGKVTLRVGMTAQRLTQILGPRFAATTIFNPTIRYRFYPEVGLAARVVQGRVTELLVVIVPRKPEDS
ncbi:MAG: M48 family metalloprotease [Blastocatellia bacterium]|nr:M48 family metalloprotease [Blastocatellia bacterium]